MSVEEKNPEAKDLPKIWYSRILTEIEALNRINCIFQNNNLKDVLTFKKKYLAWELDSQENVPSHLVFKPNIRKIKAGSRDAFIIVDGFFVVSPKFRDVLVQFDLGSTQLYKLPIFFSDGKRLSSYPPHYLVHVTETKSLLVPEESKGIEIPIPKGATEPKPTARWGEAPYQEDFLAVRAEGADGVDLWADAKMKRRFFFSDRLKTALDAAKIKSRGWKPLAAKIVP